MAEVSLSFNRPEVTTPCLVAPGGPALLGAIAREGFFLAADAVAKRLISVEGFIGDLQDATYLIVNLVDRVLDVFREPGPEPAAPFGWRYQSVTTNGPEGSVAPLAAHGTRIPVADLLP